MKSIKHLDIKNNKVLLGLFSLLFLLVTAQTAAILSTQDKVDSNSQTSQVISSSGCISISPTYNFDEPMFFGEGSTNTPGNFYSFSMHYRITNNCLYPIKIVDPASLHTSLPIQNLKNTGLQIFNSVSEASPIAVNDFLNNSYNIKAVGEIIDCYQCGSGAQTFHSSSVGNNGQVRVFSLAAGQTKAMNADVRFELPDNPSYIFRATLKNIKWFRDSALSDGSVSASEISTSSFHPSVVNNNASDYVRIYHGPTFSGLTGGETKDNTIKIDTKTGLPIKTQ